MKGIGAEDTRVMIMVMEIHNNGSFFLMDNEN